MAKAGTGTEVLLAGEPGPPLGVIGARRYQVTVVPIEPGDLLVLYSDGPVERRREIIEEAISRLVGALRQEWDPRQPLADVCDALVRRSLQGSARQDDA